MDKIKYIIMMLLIPTCAFGAIQADGVDDKLGCGSDASLDDICTSGSAGCTIYVRFQYEDTQAASSPLLIQKGWQQNNGWNIWTGTDDVAVFYTRFAAAANAGIQGTTGMVDGTEYSVVVTWDGQPDMDNTIIYLNGSDDTNAGTKDGEVGAYESDAADNLTMMLRDGATTQPSGHLHREAAVWDSILTADQISILHNSKVRHTPLQISPSDLEGYWVLDDEEDGTSADGDTFIDLSGNANTCTGDDGANNSGLTATAETVLSYP